MPLFMHGLWFIATVVEYGPAAIIGALVVAALALSYIL